MHLQALSSTDNDSGNSFTLRTHRHRQACTCLHTPLNACVTRAAGAVPSTTPAAVAGAGAGTADATAPKVAAEGDAGVTLAKMSLEETKKVKFEGDGSDDGSDEGKKKTSAYRCWQGGASKCTN